MVRENDIVTFAMPVEGRSTGRVKHIDGAYVYIAVQLEDVEIEIERYTNEIKVVDFPST